jgi:serine/threonine-protein kinase
VLIGFLQGTRKDKGTDATHQAENESPPPASDIQKPVQRPARQTADKPVGGRKPATVISLIIIPWGEVYLDGRKQGVSPPLKILRVKPGIHRLEIRNTSFPAHTQTVEIRPGEKLRIKHRFR